MKNATVLLVLVMVITASCNPVPKEFEPICEQYKIYFDKKMQAYIFKMRNQKLGAYTVYKCDDEYYCKMKVGMNSGDFMYYGRSYATAETALRALELGMYGYQIVDYDDELNIHYMGDVLNYDIKKRCETICE